MCFIGYCILIFYLYDPMRPFSPYTIGRHCYVGAHFYRWRASPDACRKQ